MPPQVDLLLEFRASSSIRNHNQTLDDARKAEQQYTKLLKVLSDARLHAVGRRGESLGHILVFIRCPDSLIQELLKQERSARFVSLVVLM